MNIYKMYSPNQVLWGSLLGGPFASVYFLKKNCDVLDDSKTAKSVMIFGGLFCLALIIIVPFLPENFPSVAIPIAYSFAAKEYAKNYHLGLDNRVSQSNWRVFLLSIALMATFIVSGVIIAMSLDKMGILDFPYDAASPAVDETDW